MSKGDYKKAERIEELILWAWYWGRLSRVPQDCKIKPCILKEMSLNIHRRTAAAAEAPIPDAKRPNPQERPDAGKDRRQEEMGHRG